MGKSGRGNFWLIAIVLIGAWLLLTSFQIAHHRSSNPSTTISQSVTKFDTSTSQSPIKDEQPVATETGKPETNHKAGFRIMFANGFQIWPLTFSKIFYLFLLLGISFLISRTIYKKSYAKDRFLYLWWGALVAIGLIPVFYATELIGRTIFLTYLLLAGLLGTLFYFSVFYQKQKYDDFSEKLLNIVATFSVAYYLLLIPYFVLGHFLPDWVKWFEKWPLWLQIGCTVVTALLLNGVCLLMRRLVKDLQKLAQRGPDIQKMTARKDIKGLIKLLSHPKNSYIREEAAKALVKIGQDVVRPLTKLLKSRNNHARKLAIQTLGEIGGPEAVDELMKLFNGPDQSIWQDTGQALLLTKDPRVAMPLFADINKWNNGSFRNLLTDFKALIQKIIDPQIQAEVVERIIAQINLDDGWMFDLKQFVSETSWNPSANETGAIYWAMEHAWDQCTAIGGPAIKSLVSILNNKTFQIRLGAAKALVAIYQSGRLTEAEKKQILQLRQEILKPHVDHQAHTDYPTEHIDERMSNDCGHRDYIVKSKNHSDGQFHQDDGYGIDFPV